MDVLSGRTLIRPTNPAASQAFYRDTLGLAIYREFGPPDAPSLVLFCGNGLLEISGHPTPAQAASGAVVCLWLQVRDVEAEFQRLRQAGVTTLREPRPEPWGLIEAWIADPDGIQIVLVQIPADHPLRRDQRPIETLQ